jgi:tetratricopeptide (TPR) repeat protein
MVRRLVHVVVVALVLAGLAVAIQVVVGGPMIAVAGAVWLAWYLGGAILLPRLAHAAFRAGETTKARRRYRILAVISPSARDAARISIAGAYLIDRDWERAQRALLAIDGEQLPGLMRGAWLNNRAYAIARGGTGDTADALALVDEALAIRPGVPGFLHTRGLALLATGRDDEAIRAFEAVWDAGEVDAILEAERCHDLAVAWEKKGHTEYAADYRLRAMRAAPTSPWAIAIVPPSEEIRALEAQIAT